MQPIRVLSVNHTSLTVREIKPLLPFFMDGLGYELHSLAPRDPAVMTRATGIPGVVVTVAILSAYGHTLELMQYYAPHERRTMVAKLCDAGATHLAYDVESIEAAIAMAANYGFALAGEVIVVDAGPNKGRRVCYVRNPEGVAVEFLERAAQKSETMPPFSQSP